VEALRGEYGEDRTFAIPILTNCGLAGLVDWNDIPALPFELAVFPHSWYKALRLHVVSYALPALIAIGLLLDRRRPPAGVLRRLVRKAARPRVLEKLRRIQPEQGGFLEAAPLTSFVAMAMTALYGRGQPVAAECLRFLRRSQRSEGAWPIDTNLSVWLTTAAVAALSAAGRLTGIDRGRTARWIAARQYQARHLYTQAEPGGWAWTHLPGGVPDVDDTSGAILALGALGHGDGIAAGLRWLLALQNRDGGWPTFCRGWGKLPFDRSSPDVTAHALRAIHSAAEGVGPQRAIRRGLDYLRRVQQADGSWIPLWFGNQRAPGQANPVLGTSRVLRALEILDRGGPPAARGVQYLLRAQNADGGWGGAESVPSSLEETALAVAALAPWAEEPATRPALVRGVRHLVAGLAGVSDHPSPIGLYFARLWYSEQLYPLIWSLEALGRVVRAGLPSSI
jgi:squalene-hopene/tetraprenyl-beta-curcumene cyclase